MKGKLFVENIEDKARFTIKTSYKKTEKFIFSFLFSILIFSKLFSNQTSNLEAIEI